MNRVDLSGAAVSARLREVSRAADLRPDHRLDAKIDLGPAAISKRLRSVSELRRLCLALARSTPIGA